MTPATIGVADGEPLFGSRASAEQAHGPQSAGQLEQVSPTPQVPFGQPGQGPQSVGQVEQVSPRPQVPLPQAESHGSPQIEEASPAHRLSHETLQQKKSTSHTAVTHGLQPSTSSEPTRHSSWVQVPVQVPQSLMQVAQVSPAPQVPSPQVPGQAPQSPGQVEQVSEPVQKPSPQITHIPQSVGQVAQSSPRMKSQRPSPQEPLHRPQSAGQVPHSSAPGEQTLSPQHCGQTPQSSGQYSPASQ